MPIISYTLEVVRFNLATDKNDRAAMYTHVGYMDAHFRTTRDACSYYARHNPHMRALDAHGGQCSDWDPATKLAYIIREEQSVHATVPPFDPADMSYREGNSIISAWLK
jgi:hypothetical protein